jgi:peptide/nickel transport system permease protein
MAAVQPDMLPAGSAPAGVLPAPSAFSAFLRRYARNRVAVGAAVVLALIMLSALFAPVLSPHDPNAQTLKLLNHGPMPGHPLGLDEIGRDELSRLIYGGRISISVGLVSAAIAMFLGILVGAVAGYFGGWVDNVLMRFVDIVLSIPAIALLIVVAAIVPHPGVFTVMLVIGSVSWPGVARIVRGEFLSLRERDFVEAERAAGATGSRIMWVHLLPNAMAPIIVASALAVAGAILTEAALSFLGLGVQQPTPSWGNMLQAASNYRALVYYWWQWIPAGLAILITTVCIYVMGDALRDALDPRLKV